MFLLALLILNEHSLNIMQKSSKTFTKRKASFDTVENLFPYHNHEKRNIDIAAVLRNLSTVIINTRTGIPRPQFATTPNLKALFFGRCYEYQFQKRNKLIKWDCEKIWKAFVKAFVYKEACNVHSEDYRPMLEMLDEQIPVNKVCYLAIVTC